MLTPADHRRPRENRLLAALPPDEYERLLPDVEVVHLGFKELLYDFDKPIPNVAFPLNGVVSLLATAEESPLVEIGTVGNEGFVGLPLFLGADRTPGKAFSQIPGDYARMSAEQFGEHVCQNPAFHRALHRYTLALFSQIAQSAACNRMHSIRERCSCWLLMTCDRVSSNEFPLTHEFLSQMLGVRRAGVTEVAGALQREGLIQYRRGIMRILDRPGLEAASCQCYAIVRNEFDRLICAL